MSENISNEAIAQTIANLSKLTQKDVTINELEDALLPLYREAHELFFDRPRTKKNNSRPMLLQVAEHIDYLEDTEKIVQGGLKLQELLAADSYYTETRRRNNDNNELIESVLREIACCLFRLGDMNLPSYERDIKGTVTISTRTGAIWFSDPDFPPWEESPQQTDFALTYPQHWQEGEREVFFNEFNEIFLNPSNQLSPFEIFTLLKEKRSDKKMAGYEGDKE